MGFTTPIFFFVFLPICLIAYYAVLAAQRLGRFGKCIKKLRIHDVVLVIFGLGFYGWTCFDNISRLMFYMFLIFAFGKIIGKCRTENGQPVTVGGDGKNQNTQIRILVTSLFVVVVVFCLVYSKYWSEVISGWNSFFGTELPQRSITAPLAISFLTFSAVSYLVDVSRGKATTGSLLDCMLYLSFFPKIISGPTVLWQDFQAQLPSRKSNFDGVSDGFTRIMIGFAKKVLIADTLGSCMVNIPETNIDAPTAWISAFLYMLQIYYDFAGYSDIAIGLSKVFGFEIKENFNFPYCSTSVGEFWRRWHISLGTWFREYVYFPLGGSRRGLVITLRNLGVVFLLTGIWHGSGKTYLVWGAVNGICVILERLLSGKKVYEKIPRLIKWLCTMFITLICWEIFRFGNLESVRQWGKIACGMISYQNINTWQNYFDMQILVIAVIGTLGATLFGIKPIRTYYQKLISGKVGYAIQQAVLLVLFVVAVMFMVSSGYSPFIYFQY